MLKDAPTMPLPLPEAGLGPAAGDCDRTATGHAPGSTRATTGRVQGTHMLLLNEPLVVVVANVHFCCAVGALALVQTLLSHPGHVSCHIKYCNLMSVLLTGGHAP